MKIDMRTLKGKRFGDLPEPIKTKLLTSYTSIYYGTYFDGIELKEPIQRKIIGLERKPI